MKNKGTIPYVCASCSQDQDRKSLYDVWEYDTTAGMLFWIMEILLQKSKEVTPKKSRFRLPEACAGGLLCICCKQSFSPDIINSTGIWGGLGVLNATPTQQQSRRMIITFSNSGNCNLTLHPCPEAATLPCLNFVWL